MRPTLVLAALLLLLALCSIGASFNCAEAELVRLDPANGDRADSVEVGDPSTIGHLAVGGGAVWLGICGLVQVDVEDADVVKSSHDVDGCGPITYGSGAIWRLSSRGLVKLDPVTGEEARARLPGRSVRDPVVEGMDLAAGRRAFSSQTPASAASAASTPLACD